MRILPLFIGFFICNFLGAQVQLQVEITGATVNTTCTDLLSAPDPLWQVNIENTGWTTYPQSGGCFTALPNVQFSRPHDCPSDLPATLEICFKVFENDGLFGCNIAESCSETVCQRFPTPRIGQTDLSLSLPAGLSSSGTLNFSIKIVGNYIGNINDRICEAHDLGVLNFASRIGDATTGGFDNFCATVAGDPNPADISFNGWQNDAGVWFSFQTGPNPSGGVYIRALNDPQNTGNPINLQLAVFESTNDTCTGNLTLLQHTFSNDSNFDEALILPCVAPNRRYYVLIDGDENTNMQKGVFGVEIIDPGILEGGDLRCEAYNLGPVPEGGSVESPWQSNYCASSVGDPIVRGFVSQRSIFFRVEPPASGHFLIEAISDKIVDPIGLQIAIYRSSNNLCTGLWTQVASFYTEEGLDEQLEVSCLTPSRPYFILIDGDAYDTYGILKIRVTDLGDDTPVFNLVDTICAGEQIIVGSSVYAQSGNYVDTISLAGGCDSVVMTSLTVLEPVVVTITQTRKADAEGSPTGSLLAAASGGSGNYTFEWSNGFTGAEANGLIGGQTYCVTVTDNHGCSGQSCFYVDFVKPILPNYINGAVDCFGDSDGSFRFSVNNGEAPYQYFWAALSSQLTGNGTISADDEWIQVDNLSAGIYRVTVSDIYTDTVFSVEITQPSEIRISVAQKTDASCFGVCDGSIQVSVQGGVGSYSYEWSNGASSNNQTTGLCAGGYIVTVTDGNGCRKLLPVLISQPPEFIAGGEEVQPVSCFGGADGIGNVFSNGAPVSYEWSDGNKSQQNSGLLAGNYTVTVTNSDGCKDTTQLVITQPAEAVRMTLSVESPITCNGDSDGVLSASPGGPGQDFSIVWSSGAQGTIAGGLSEGLYFVTVTNEKGCQAEDSVFLSQPEKMEFSFTTKNLNCLDPPDGGAIEIISSIGGLPPYQYSTDGINFSDETVIRNLVVGSYELVVKDALGCESQESFFILPPPVLTVSLQADQLIELGEVLNIRAFANSEDVNFEWSENVPCVQPDCETQEFLPFASDSYRVAVTDTITFCTATDEIFVEVLKKYDVFIPSAFSPNYDGINDKLVIFGGKSVAIIEQFAVFDRFGAQVFELKNFSPGDEMFGWDGTWRGKEADSGVYVFLAEVKFIDGKTEMFKGDVTLIR